jgi:hypothetical protein
MPSTAPSGFNYFRDAWNYEVGHCYLASVHRKEDIVVIYRKSTKQLQERFDHLEETRQAAFLETPYTESLKRAMDCELQASSNMSSPCSYSSSHGATDVSLEGDPSNIPAGDPLTLQPEITMLNVGRWAIAFWILVNAHIHPYQGCRLMLEPLSFRQFALSVEEKRLTMAHLVDLGINV